jgi:hypothetical protein
VPTRKPRRIRPPTAKRIAVRFSRRERTEIGVGLLAIADGTERTAALAELERILGADASALANVANVRLRSDLVGLVEPLVLRVRALSRELQKTDAVTLTYAEAGSFFSVPALAEQLQGVEDFLEWIKSEAPKKGGERRAYRKQTLDNLKAGWSTWFDRHAEATKAEVRSRKSRFVKHVQAIVERAAAVV